MHAWEQIQQTVDYIEEHIAEEIKIETLAKSVALSQFYYQRLFSRLVNKPVNEYVKLRRLAKAADCLPTHEKRIIDIALECGFSSHEIFTRTFKNAFGMTPEEYRANPVRLNKFIKPQLLLNYTLVDENVPLIAEGIVLEIGRHRISSPQYFIGLTAEEPIKQMPGGGETGIDSLGELWDTLHASRLCIQEIKPNGDELGVAYASKRDDHYCYFAGAEVDSNLQVDGYNSWIVEAGEYIVCSFEAEDFEHLVMDAIYRAHKYLFETWLPNHQIVTKPFAMERYASHTPDTTKMEIWVMPTII
jgi:AraC family transcriptional regulator